MVFVGFVISLVACLPKLDIGTPGSSPVPPRLVMDSTLPFHEKWRISNLLIPFGTTTGVNVYGDRLFFVAYAADRLTHWLEVIDAKSGSLLWKTKPLPFTEDSLEADQQRLYLVLSRKILAYDHLTGEVLWETDELLGGHTTYSIYPMGDTLFVYSEEDTSSERREQVIRKYNSQNGLLIDINHIEINHNDSLLAKVSFFDYWTNGKALWAINNETEQQQWNIGIDNRVEYQPLLAE